ncbi:MAG: hypothetical protein NTY93_03410 [Candidatus Kaiserbacteria bacterium]|nr:hypothetical protein [Candidatus Kaiserbacteria bacterium]
MNHTRLLSAAVIIALVIIVGFVLSVPHTRDSALTDLSQTKTANIPTVALHDVFKKGVHTITGSLNAPNACAAITAKASLVGDASNATGILVAISMSEDTDDVCLQLPTRMNFSVTISAPASLPLTATVNGFVATTTAS